MTSRSASATISLRTRGAAVLSVALLACVPAAPVQADVTPSPGAGVSPNPTTAVGASATSLAGLTAPVRDIITTVESVDGTETQQDTRSRRTVILASKVLFPEDRATLSAAARDRLRSVARQIVDSKATGTVKVDGYTDDQGSAQHGLVLSRQRARAVRGVLTPLVAGSPVRIAIRGLGEANPRVPNADKAGRPIPANQAKNRRVEISFAQGR